jgi:hypothetical protein
MAFTIKRGQTSVIIRAILKDSSVTTGAGKTGLSSASAGLIISVACDNEATPTAYTQAGSTIESITTLGTYAAPTATKVRFKEFDATNCPGMYEFQIADARFAVASSKYITIGWTGAANLAQDFMQIPLVIADPYDPSTFFRTALTESYAALASAPTPEQFMMAAHMERRNFAYAGTTKTVYKLDNATTAYVITFDSSTPSNGHQTT